MTADALCASCKGFLVWFDEEGWVHRDDPADFHDPILEGGPDA